jgi:hypothetical protein
MGCEQSSEHLKDEETQDSRSKHHRQQAADKKSVHRTRHPAGKPARGKGKSSFVRAEEVNCSN